jgi:hypothetical protein
VRERRHAGRRDHAGRDAVGRDAELPELERERAREAETIGATSLGSSRNTPISDPSLSPDRPRLTRTSRPARRVIYVPG